MKEYLYCVEILQEASLRAQRNECVDGSLVGLFSRITRPLLLLNRSLLTILQEASLRAQQNVCVDGSLRNVEWYSKVFDDIRKRFPHYRIALLLIGASKEVVYDRVRRRAAKTKRFVPEERILDSLASLPRAMAVLVCVCGGECRAGGGL